MTIRIRRPDDFHVHLRQGDMLANLATCTGAHFARALVMPNTDPPIIDESDVVRYREEIVQAMQSHPWSKSWTTGALSYQKPVDGPLMTIKLTRDTTPEIVHGARAVGAIAIKFYPEGATTNASGGYGSLREVPRDVLDAIAASSMVLCVHAEDPHAFVMDREKRFVDQIGEVLAKHSLRVVVEHLTSRYGVEFVKKHRNSDRRLVATITAHHLWSTLDDVVGGTLSPHAFCKPIPKTPDDREALIEAATDQLSWDDAPHPFFFGSDSAPHLRGRKECASGCAGAFAAPVALSLLAEVFEAHAKGRWYSSLERFASVNGARFYGLPPNEGMLTLEPTGFLVPDEICGVVPFLAGRRMRWAIANNEPDRKSSP
jgi:dihydroorotase